MTTPTPANPEAKAEPLTDAEIEQFRRGHTCDISIATKQYQHRLLATISHLQSRLEAAEKFGAPVAGAVALSHVKDPCKLHNAYWTTSSGSCMACRAVQAEARATVLRAEVDAWRAAVSDGAYVVNTEHESFAGRMSFTKKTQAAIDRLQAARDATDSLPKGDDNAKPQ